MTGEKGAFEKMPLFFIFLLTVKSLDTVRLAQEVAL